MYEGAKTALSKVPEVTLGFWIIKILATTIGETGGDAVTMSLFHADKDAHNGGYLIGACVFMAVFIATVVVQITRKRFHPFVYWVTIVATTTVGTAMADFADRSLGIGYLGGSSLLFALLIMSLFLWRLSEGTVSVNAIVTPQAEVFYWITILFSQTLSTALGDWMADTNNLGYGNAAIVFGAGLLLLAAVYYFSNVSRVFLFWAAFILTRPLGATLGDLFDKPMSHGGFEVSRTAATAIDGCPHSYFPKTCLQASRFAFRDARGMRWRALMDNRGRGRVIEVVPVLDCRRRNTGRECPV